MAEDSKEPRLLERIRNWRDQLINLTRRNRLLYFKPTKSSTLVIDAPSLGEVLRRLDQHRRSGWGFYTPPDPTGSGSEGESNEDVETREVRAEDELGTQFSDASHLQRTLRNLDRQANQEYLDKGIWVLYLGVGMLVWRDEDLGIEVKSPLVLKPVLVSRETPRSPYRLTATDEDVVVNPSLLSKLEADFGITLPDLSDRTADDVLEFLEDVRARVRRHQMSVVNEGIVSTFSFHKEVMYRDLKENEQAVAESPVVRALALGRMSGADLGFDRVPEDRLDEEFPPERALAILDADTTQQQCLAAAAAGHSFVMDGPPGTGKSQTIANIIAGAMRRGQSILFVSEKAAALDVVSSRLAEKGLDEYLLELHSHKTRRREFASGLAKSLTVRPSPPSRVSRQRLAQLVQRRRELNEYATALNEVREPLGESLLDVIGRVVALESVAGVPIADAVDGSLTPDTVHRILRAAGELSRAWGPVERRGDFLWRDCTVESADGVSIQGITRDLEGARGALSQLLEAATTAADILELAVPTRLATVPELLELLEHLADRPAYWHTPWLREEMAERAWVRAERLAEASTRHSSLEASLKDRMGEGWRDVDPSLADQLGAIVAAAQAIEPPWRLSSEADSLALSNSLEALDDMLAALREVASHSAVLAQGFGLSADDLSVDDLHSLAQLGARIGLRPQPDQRWMNPLDIAAAKEAAGELHVRVRAYREQEALLAQTFSARVLAIEDLEDLTARFEHRHRGLRKLLPLYWADRKVVAMASRAGRATKDVIGRLPEAVAWQKRRDDLRRAEERWADRLGDHYYRGLETDFAEVAAALDNCEDLLAQKPKLVADEALEALFSVQGRPSSAVRDAARDVTQTLGRLERGLAEEQFDQSWRSRRINVIADWLAHIRATSADALAVLRGLEESTDRTLPIGAALQALRIRVDVKRCEDGFTATAGADKEMLGPGYDLWRSDWQLIVHGANWARRLLELLPEQISDAMIEVVSNGLAGPDRLAAAFDSWRHHRDRVLRLFAAQQRTYIADVLGGAFVEIDQLIDDLLHSTDEIDEWVTFRAACAELRSYGLAPLVEYCVKNKVPSDQVVAAARRSILQAWVECVLKADPRVKQLRRAQREAIVSEFREIDSDIARHAVAEIVEACNARRPTQALGGAGLIRAEGQKKKRHRPIRNLMAEAREVIQALKPCFMMSPLSVSQFVDPQTRFDLVVFDEASQVQPADAINCIYRGRQVIIAGDQKQLPPTSFFTRVSSDEDSEEWSEEQFDEFESVLDVAVASGLEPLPLRWHYRSRHEGLITFSNFSFYDGTLVTYPAPNEARDGAGVELFHVKGQYRRATSRDNPVEAEAVADRVLHHARCHPNRSLGVVAFSEAQASLIEYVIERRRRDQPDLDAFFEGDRLSGFFVKNLENVQGDERDTMIFSVGYGPDEFGKFTLNFGPLNRAGGERRLNVAITRARERVEVISSVLASDFGSSSASPGVLLLRSYLDYAERGVAALAHEIGPTELDAESPFEEEVIRVIRSWGYGVQPQVGSAGYRIDVGVRSTEDAGPFVLGVECDGAQYHSSRVARDRDRLRQSVLENLGWRIYRVWGPAWYRTRDDEMRRLKHAIDEAIASGNARDAGAYSTSYPRPLTISTREVMLDERPGWAIAYEVSKPRIRPGVDLGATESLPYVLAAVREVVERESPVSIEVALGRVRAAGGALRAGVKIRSVFDQAVSTLKRQGVVNVDRRMFLWSSMSGMTRVRVPKEGDPATKRGVGDVPREEIQLAVLGLLRDAITAERDELTARVAALFGWSRRGAGISAALDQALNTLVRGKAITREGELLRLSSEPQTGD